LPEGVNEFVIILNYHIEKNEARYLKKIPSDYKGMKFRKKLCALL